MKSQDSKYKTRCHALPLIADWDIHSVFFGKEAWQLAFSDNEKPNGKTTTFYNFTTNSSNILECSIKFTFIVKCKHMVLFVLLTLISDLIE